MARTVDEDGFVSSSSDERKRRQLLAHAREDGKPHTDGPDAAMHGRRGSGTWGDGTSKSAKKYHQNGRTFGDGTPVTSTNYSDFKRNPDQAPKKKKKK